MSIIHRHQIIHCAAIILLLLSFQRVGNALSYWDAIFEIGFNPETQAIDAPTACRQIERLIKYRKAVHELPVFDEKLNNKIQEVESRISSLDAGNLYDQLPYSDRNGQWRSIGIRGGVAEDHYQVAIVDPGIENWLKTFSKGNPELWGPQDQFGDFGVRVFIRPVTKDKYRLATEGHAYIDDLNSANMVRIIVHLVKIMGLLAGEGVPPPPDFLKGSGLGHHSLKVIYGMARDFPNLFEIFKQYVTIEKVLFGKSTKPPGPKTFDIVIRINIKAIKKDYPHVGKLLDRLKGLLNFKAAVFNPLNQQIITLAFDGDKYLFSIRFRTQGDRFLVLDKIPEHAKVAGINLTDSGSQNFYMIYTFRLNIAGLKLTVEALKVDLNYFFEDSGANIKAGLQQPPKQIKAQGLVMGFLPIWLVDIFIPSNIGSMTQEFFNTLASGNNGNGVAMLFGSIPENSLKHNLWFLTDAEILSNGTMKFALNLQQKMVKEEDQLLEEFKAFETQLWKAFYHDFSRIKSLQFCRP